MVLLFPKMTGSDFFTSADPLLSANNSLINSATSIINLGMLANRGSGSMVHAGAPPSPPWDAGNDLDLDLVDVKDVDEFLASVPSL